MSIPPETRSQERICEPGRQSASTAGVRRRDTQPHSHEALPVSCSQSRVAGASNRAVTLDRSVDVVTNPNELALPPKIDAKEVVGYGLYFAEQTLHGRLFESIDELKGHLPELLDFPHSMVTARC